MDRTVVSNTGTTVRRRNAGRTRNTSGKSIFTGAVRARSRWPLAVPVAPMPRLRGGLGQRGTERLGAGERCDRTTQVGEVETIGERFELVPPAGAEVDGADRRTQLVGERSREPVDGPPECERSGRSPAAIPPRAGRGVEEPLRRSPPDVASPPASRRTIEGAGHPTKGRHPCGRRGSPPGPSAGRSRIARFAPATEHATAVTSRPEARAEVTVPPAGV